MRGARKGGGSLDHMYVVYVLCSFFVSVFLYHHNHSSSLLPVDVFTWRDHDQYECTLGTEGARESRIAFFRVRNDSYAEADNPS